MACLSGDYAKGVAILSELYVDTKDRTYLFNQGRCFEQNGRYADAILRFREYLRKIRDAGAAPDADAERHIADCEALLAKEKNKAAGSTSQAADGASQPAAGGASQPAAPPALARPTTALPAPIDVVPVPAQAGTRGSGLRVAGIAAIAVGGAGLVTGLILNLKANGLADELESTTDNYQRSKESTRKSYQTFAWLSYGLGAACVVGGALAYYVGRILPGNDQVALVPMIGPGAAGAVLRGAF